MCHVCFKYCNPAGTFRLSGQLRVVPTSPVNYSHPVERDTPDEACEDSLKAWSVGHTEPPPPVEVAHCQKAWDVLHVNINAAFKAIQTLPQMPLSKPSYRLPVGKSQELGFMRYK